MIFAPLSNVWVQRLGQQGGRHHRPAASSTTSLAAVHARSSPTAACSHVIGVTDADGPRHGQRHGALHRLDHGLAAAGQGRRRLGGQRHDPPDGRRGRRRGVRLADGQPLPQPASPTSSAASLPAPLLHQVRDNVGQAVGVATAAPAARPVRGADRRPRPRTASSAACTSSVSWRPPITLLAAIGVALVPPRPRERRPGRRRPTVPTEVAADPDRTAGDPRAGLTSSTAPARTRCQDSVPGGGSWTVLPDARRRPDRQDPGHPDAGTGRHRPAQRVRDRGAHRGGAVRRCLAPCPLPHAASSRRVASIATAPAP